MDSFFSMLFDLLITPPGNYLYYVLLAIFVISTLQAVYLNRRGQLDESRSRILIGLFLILLVQILALSSSLLGWSGLADPRQFLPPVDRAAALLMVGVIFWFWVFPEPSHTADVIFLAAGGIVFFFLIGNLFNQFSLPPEIPYNATLWDWVWQILTMITALIAVVVLINRRPENWGTGTGLFGVILVGYLLNLALITNEGSFSGITRLALLIAFVLLPTVAHRFQPAEPQSVPKVPEPVVDQTASKREFEELETWLELNARQDLDSFFPALTRLVCQTLRADRCFVVVPSETRGQISFQAGFNNETGESFPLSSASDALLPAVTRAAFFGRAQLFDQMENREELNHLAVAAQIAGIGSAMFEPFSPQQKKWGGLLVIKSATRKGLDQKDQQRLSTLAHSASLVLGKIVELTLHAHSLKTMAQDLESARLENLSLKEDLKRISEQSGYERAEPELNALLAVQQESQDLIASLQRENRRLLKELEESDDKASRTDAEQGGTKPADLSSSKVKAVEAMLEELQAPVSDLEERIGAVLDNSAPAGEAEPEEVLKAMHASLENIHSRLSDLGQMDVLVKGLASLEALPTDVNQVIDQTMAATRAQLSYKALNLRIDLPDRLPAFFSYPGALKIALVRLVESAIASSAIGADIELKIQAVDGADDENGQLLFQVTDFSGGADFSADRLSPGQLSEGERSDNGKGGLFLARRLVEAHGGRLWIEGGEEEAFVMNMLFPLRPLLAPLTKSE